MQKRNCQTFLPTSLVKVSSTNFCSYRELTVAISDRTKTLTSEEFVSFQADLQRDILKMEFSLLHPDSEGIIKEKDFANMLLIHARFDHDKTRKIRKRINRLYKKQKIKEVNEETGEEETIIIEPVDNGVSFDQIENFFNFIKNIHDVEIAFTFFAMSVCLE